jgi:hypothetical protein
MKVTVTTPRIILVRPSCRLTLPTVGGKFHVLVPGNVTKAQAGGKPQKIVVLRTQQLSRARIHFRTSMSSMFGSPVGPTRPVGPAELDAPAVLDGLTAKGAISPNEELG